MTVFADLAALSEARPPMSCRLGFHRGFQAQQLITTGHFVCTKCGLVFLTSLFGDFPKSRAESAAWLRARDSDRSGGAGETAKTGSTEGESAGPEGIAHD